ASLSALSVLAPSSLRLLRHESEVAEEENAQAEAQEKKDEAEVQVSQPVHLRRLQEQK
ncbi:mCG130546, isoform CRA_a, partial [Mus musculus]